MNKPSKYQQIKQHLIQGRSITGLSAIKLYGCYRLSSVIHRLRDEGGLIIDTQLNGNSYARYSIKKSNPATAIDSLFEKT